MDQKRKNYSITCFKKSEAIYKTFYHIAFLEICKLFQLMPKGLVARKTFCVGGTSKEFQNKWDCRLKEREMKCQDLLSEEYCRKSFSLITYIKNPPDFWDGSFCKNRLNVLYCFCRYLRHRCLTEFLIDLRVGAYDGTQMECF